jgi:hypothetical protein
MTRETFDERLRGLYAKLEHEKNELIKEYAAANNQYKVGDIIEDHSGRGEITSIGFYISASTPQCIYTCRPLNKDGSYSKKDKNRYIYAMNILKQTTY